MCEAAYHLKRPVADAKAALDIMEPEVRHSWLRAAHAALRCWHECLERESAGMLYPFVAAVVALSIITTSASAKPSQEALATNCLSESKARQLWHGHLRYR